LFLIHSIRFNLIVLTVAVRDGSQFADVRHDDLIAELLPLETLETMAQDLKAWNPLPMPHTPRQHDKGHLLHLQ
jgi:hypothetical protein